METSRNVAHVSAEQLRASVRELRDTFRSTDNDADRAIAAVRSIEAIADHLEEYSREPGRQDDPPSLSDLLRRRQAINEELERRALAMRELLRGYEGPQHYRVQRLFGNDVGDGDHVECLQSTDRGHVLMAFYHSAPRYGERIPRDLLHEKSADEQFVMFPPLPGRGGDDGIQRSYQPKIVAPIAAFDAGADAIMALWRTEDERRADEYMQYQRRQYEELRAKFGGQT